MAFTWQSRPRKHKRHGSIPPEQIHNVFTVMALGGRYQDENLSISNSITTVGTLEECLAEIHGPTLTRCRWWQANRRLSAERVEPNGRARQDCFHGLLAERTLEWSNPARPQMGNQRPEGRGGEGSVSVSHRWVEPDLNL